MTVEKLKHGLDRARQILQSKRQPKWSRSQHDGYDEAEERRTILMEYLIGFATALVATLYVVVIVGCLRQTEW